MTDSAVPRQGVVAANLICVASMLTWAAGLPLLDILVDDVPPFFLTAARIGLAGAALVAVWIVVEGWGAVRRAPWVKGIGIGFVVMGVGAVLVAIALQQTDAVTVAIITAMMPVVGIALECALDGRRLTPMLVAGLLLSLAGGLVALDLTRATPSLGMGALAAAGSVLAFTWGSRASVTSFPDLTPLGRTAITVGGGGIALLVLAVLWGLAFGTGIDWPALGWTELSMLVVAAIGGVSISQTLWIVAVGRLGIGISSLHMNAVPFYVMILAYALGAPWNWQQTAGAAIVVLGVMLAQGMLPGRRRA